MESKLFKIILFAGIGLTLFIHIAPEFHLFKMGETELITASYFWIFPIVYGTTGLLTYKAALEKGRSVHMLPGVISVSAILLLATFLTVIFPLL